MAVFVLLLLVCSICVGIFGGVVIYKAEKHELKRIQNIAGAVITEYPDAEKNFVEAVQDSEYSDVSAGIEIMSGYGYDYDMPMNYEYKKFLWIYAGAIFCISAIFIGGSICMIRYIIKKHERQNKTILYMLDSCISGDYGFVEKDAFMRKLNEPHFADSLTKLAMNLKLKTERLEEEQNNTKAMVTDISHQLKTPVSAMKVCMDMYLEAESAEEKQEFLERSMIQLNRLEALESALINISRLENKMIILEKHQVMLTELLVGAVNMEYHKASEKNISIEVEEFDDVMIETDHKWTVEAIANIIDNGIKYSPSGSAIKIRANKLFSFVRIEIEDSGIGIPKDERNRIFTRFFRGSSDTVKKQEGSGVGLYLSRKILEDQGGTISVKSSNHGGSIFIVQLPL